MAAAEITRDETRQRAALVQVESYEVGLDLTRGAQVFGSQVLIRFGCAQPGAATYLDLIAERVHEIVLNGERLDPALVVSAGRIALPGLAARNELRVTADCRYSGEGTGMHRSVDSADGRVYLYTKFEPAYARRVFANFEQPDLKAPFAFRVTAPAGWTVLSNQPVAASEPGPAGTTWRFPPTPRISTYLTAVVAGQYETVRGTHTTARGQQIPLALACRASLAPHLDAADVLALTGRGLDYYTGLFDGDFPFGQYAQAFVPEYSAGATENVGCVVITDQLLFPSKVTGEMYEMRAMVVLHEMAHMWFGDLVTMKWWDDLWLNESFAEFMATLSSAEAGGFGDAWTTFSIGRKTWAYLQDQLPSTHPVAADVPTLSQAVANFDGISYAKGAAVLQQLAAKVGRERFFAAIRAYFAAHAFGNATLADLLQALEASSGTRLGDWSEAWLETAGPNTLRAEFDEAADGTLTSFAITQEAPPDYPTLRPHHIAVGLYARDAGGGLTRTHRAGVDVAGPRTEVPELAGRPRPDLILVNDDDLGYARVRFDPRSLATVTQSVGGLRSSLSRAVCWTALIDMARQGELSLPAFAKAVTAGLGQEDSLPVIQVLQSVTSQLLLAGDPALATRIKAQLAAEGARLLRAAAPGSDRQLAWALLLAWTATTPDQLDLIAGLLDGGTELPGLVVDTGLRWALLRRLAATGRAGDAEIDGELARDHTDAGRRHALGGRAAIPDAEHKAAAWHLLAETQDLGTAGVSAVVLGFALPEHAALLAPYTERYFAALPEIWSVRSEHFRAMLAQALFPFWSASPELISRIDAFLSAADREPDLVRLLTERRDMVQRALAARARPG
ncbi:MAG: aminopeptidase N [Streptosporangiaceae bacterium]